MTSRATSSFYPYGEDKGTPAPNDQTKFATYTRDSATGLDYAMNRYYCSTLRRFMSPDPSQASGGLPIRRAGTATLTREMIRRIGATLRDSMTSPLPSTAMIMMAATEVTEVTAAATRAAAQLANTLILQSKSAIPPAPHLGQHPRSPRHSSALSRSSSHQTSNTSLRRPYLS